MNLDDKLRMFFAGMSGAMDEAAAGEKRNAWRPGDEHNLAYYRGQVDAFDAMFNHAQKLDLPHAHQGNVGDTLKGKP